MSDNPFTGVNRQSRPVIDEGIYDATFSSFSDVQQGANGPYVFMNFTPDTHPNVEVSIIVSIDGGWKSKGVEIARRLTGKSTATDTKWGREIKDKRPDIGFGTELIGKPCQIVVAKLYDEGLEVHKNRVTNVVPPGTFDTSDPKTDVEKELEEAPF
jgi:hypothetical protein